MIPRTFGAARLVALLLPAALAAGCASQQAWWLQDLEEWQGAPVTELLDAWGPPMRTLTGENEATVLVFERVRELDQRFETLADPASRLDPDRERAGLTRPQRSECLVFFEISAEQVTATRHEGAACDIVPRDPARRRTDPAPLRRR